MSINSSNTFFKLSLVKPNNNFKATRRWITRWICDKKKNSQNYIPSHWINYPLNILKIIVMSSKISSHAHANFKQRKKIKNFFFSQTAWSDHKHMLSMCFQTPRTSRTPACRKKSRGGLLPSGKDPNDQRKLWKSQTDTILFEYPM